MTCTLSRFAHARLVVPVDVGAHGELGLLLLRVQQRPDLARIADRVATARDGARDRTGLDAPALDPHVHLGRGGDEILPLAEVHQGAVGGGVALPEPAVEHRGRTSTGLEEHLAGHHLEEIAAPERLDRVAHGRRVLPGSVVALPLHRGGSDVRGPAAGARETVGTPVPPPRTRSDSGSRPRAGGPRSGCRRGGRAPGCARSRRAASRAGSGRTGRRVRSRTRRRARDGRPRGCGTGR